MALLVFLLATTGVISSHLLHVASQVHLDVYYESKCPFSARFVTEQLRPTIQSLSSYVDVNLVPYGNAQTERDGGKVTFTCQHGKPECLLNKIHACSINRLKDNLQRVLIASCLFEHYDEEPFVDGEMCAKKFGLNWDEVKECATGDEGTRLEDKYGKETHSLNPPLYDVPYVAVDGDAGDDNFQNLATYRLKGLLCETLAKKRVIPEACRYD